MIRSGLKPIRKNHLDYGFHETHPQFGAIINPATLPDYNCDAGLWAPNQNVPQGITGLPDIPALPEGCTDYAQTDLCIDEDGVLYDPMLLENVDHANANGGEDIRVALKTAITVFKREAYYNIQAASPLDWFGAIQVAMWATQDEKRSVSIGTPWFPEFENPTNGILPIPVFDLAGVPWHNWKISGWKTINGEQYLIGKSWQGPEYGDKGFHYVSRPLLNALLGINGTGAFTLGKIPPGGVQTVNLGFIATLVSFIRNLLGL